MMVLVTFEGPEPTVTLVPIGEGEQLTLDLLAQSDNIILEIPDENELIRKRMIVAPQETSD